MLKRITYCIVPLLYFSHLTALDAPIKYFNVIDADCNETGDAYLFESSTERKGHLVKLSFPSVGKELKSDVSVCNPENPDVKDEIVAVIERISWEGGSDDEIRITSRVSYQNKAILQEALSLLNENADIEAEFVIYEYDHHTKKHFKRLHTFNKSVKLVITPDKMAYIAEDPDNYKIKRPMNFMFEISLTPKKGIEDQKLGFAFRSNGTQFSRQLGGPLSGIIE